jgi:hypothetical protein
MGWIREICNLQRIRTAANDCPALISLLSAHDSRNPHPNCLRNGPQLGQHRLIAFPIDVVNRISQLPPGIQHLPLNIDPRSARMSLIARKIPGTL